MLVEIVSYDQRTGRGTLAQGGKVRAFDYRDFAGEQMLAPGTVARWERGKLVAYTPPVSWLRRLWRRLAGR